MLSPLVVCFIAGAMLVNLPGDHRRRLWTILTRFERPLYYLFLTLAGALWEVTDWRGWVLVPAFVISRAIGYWLADRFAPESVSGVINVRPAWFAAPVSIVSIAIVISAQAIYRGPAVPWIVTAVLGSAIVVELIGPKEAAR
jgi:L-lactate permease